MRASRAYYTPVFLHLLRKLSFYHFLLSLQGRQDGCKFISTRVGKEEGVVVKWMTKTSGVVAGSSWRWQALCVCCVGCTCGVRDGDRLSRDCSIWGSPRLTMLLMASAWKCKMNGKPPNAPLHSPPTPRYPLLIRCTQTKKVTMFYLLAECRLGNTHNKKANLNANVWKSAKRFPGECSVNLTHLTLPWVTAK